MEYSCRLFWSAKGYSKLSIKAKLSSNCRSCSTRFPSNSTICLAKFPGKQGLRLKDTKSLSAFAQWILCVFQPLTLQQLHSAFNLQNGKGCRDVDDSNPMDTDLEHLERHINDVSGGSFEVAGRPKRFARVQVIHETVREYFLSPRGCSQLLTPSRQAFIEGGHKEIALACFRGLSANGWSSIPAWEQPSPVLVDELLKSMYPQWRLVRYSFLFLYALRYAFEHYNGSRHLFPIDCNKDAHLDLSQ
ncbi:hypothetical protein CLAIMM_14867, partial [Cladophialophora immunda]